MRSKVAVNSVGLEELAGFEEAGVLAGFEVAGAEPSAGLLSSVGPPQLTKSPRERTLTNKDFLFIMFFIARQRRDPFFMVLLFQKKRFLQCLFCD